MAFENVGLVWTPESLKEYLSTIIRPDWCRAITLHHTGSPSLTDRPHGFTIRHIENIADFYRNTKKWSSGPHLFIDEDQIFGMCDLRKKGIHAISFNHFAIGIEVLGNYDRENPLSDRGLACWKNTATTTKVLLDWLKLDVNEETVLFHCEDPNTNKTCPGLKVTREIPGNAPPQKSWVLNLIQAPTPSVSQVEINKPDVGMNWAYWDFRGENWCVPIHNFLTAKGISSGNVIANLKRCHDGEFYYGKELIENAYYVNTNSNLKPNDCTWAPAMELMDLVQAVSEKQKEGGGI
jgi:hypothetical protein